MTDLPRPEFPRPDRDRSDQWMNLNGRWAFESLDGISEIVVPFAWETPSSAIGRVWLEAAVYRRSVTVPEEWRGRRIVLCFGAVHHRAEVRVDGRLVGDHVGGYTPFEFDVTELLQPGREADLSVAVQAPADKRFIPHGKQRSLPRDDYDGVCFTPSSGIWQTVWLEARGRTYVDAVRIRGDRLDAFDVEIGVAGDDPIDAEVRVLLTMSGEELTMRTDADGVARGCIVPSHPRLWSPDDPFLHPMEVIVGDDRVGTYGGLRSIATNGTAILLNGRRVYLRGVLDQGYWPETGITPPSDDAIVDDLVRARDFGYNLVRKHVKLEDPRFLYWADRLGILVWAEPASTSRYSAEGAAAFEAQIAPMVERDGNHPSVVIWGLYNEEWGLDWDIPGSADRAEAARRAYEMLRGLDSSRPIVENSGWAHVQTDLLDWHYYDEDAGRWARYLAELADGTRAGFPVRLGPDSVVEKTLNADGLADRRTVPNINSEYGGGFTSLERGWMLRWQTQELRRHDAFAGYVYTELYDVEHESAGLLDAERRPKDLGAVRPSDVNAETAIVVDMAPAEAGTDMPAPTGEWELRMRISHHGSQAVDGMAHAAWLPAGQPLPLSPSRSDSSVHIHSEPFALGEPADLRIPGAPAPRARLGLWLVDSTGAVRARSHVDVGPLEVSIPAAAIEPARAQIEAI